MVTPGLWFIQPFLHSPLFGHTKLSIYYDQSLNIMTDFFTSLKNCFQYFCLIVQYLTPDSTKRQLTS